MLQFVKISPSNLHVAAVGVKERQVHVIYFTPSFLQAQLLWKKTPRSWKLLRRTAPAPKPGRLLTPVRKDYILLHSYMHRWAEVYTRAPVYPVDLFINTDILNWFLLTVSFPSFCLSSTPHVLALIWFTSSFLFILLSFFLLSILFVCVVMFGFAPSSHPASAIGFMVYHLLRMLPPPLVPSLSFPFPPATFTHHLGPSSTSLAGHWLDAQPRAGWHGSVLHGLTGPP